MEIRKSIPTDLKEILALYKNARKFMAENGNPTQWGNHYPEQALVIQDIEEGHSYVCLEEGKIVGTFFYKKGVDPTYERIEEGNWLNDKPYGVVHRITSSLNKRGVASFCLEWCFENCKNIKIDTHQNNKPMQKLLKKRGFIQCGVIYLENGEERIAFQKIQ